MARPILDDALWQIIEPLLPPPKRRRKRFPGRKPLDDRAVLTGILFVLKSGIAWETLPQELGCGSGMTCWRRLAAWQKSGVWDNVLRALRDRLSEAGQSDSTQTTDYAALLKTVLGKSKSPTVSRIAARPRRTIAGRAVYKKFRLRGKSTRPLRTL